MRNFYSCIQNKKCNDYTRIRSRGQRSRVRRSLFCYSKRLAGSINEGTQPHEIGVFVRSDVQLPRACAAVEKLHVPYRILDDRVETASGQVSISTMHLAKGLEFRAVCVMACDDEVVPLQERIEIAGDDADLEEFYNTERHLLYVACTRAKKKLKVPDVLISLLEEKHEL